MRITKAALAKAQSASVPQNSAELRPEARAKPRALPDALEPGGFGRPEQRAVETPREYPQINQEFHGARGEHAPERNGETKHIG